MAIGISVSRELTPERLHVAPTKMTRFRDFPNEHIPNDLLRYVIHIYNANETNIKNNAQKRRQISLESDQDFKDFKFEN